MSYLLLSELLIVLVAFAFAISKGDLFSPPVLFISVFIFVTFLCYLGLSTWNDYELSISTASIVLLGCFSFLIGGMLAEILKAKEPLLRFKSADAISFVQEIRLETINKKLILLIIIIVILAIIKIKEIKEIGGASSTDLASLIASARYKTSHLFNSIDDDVEQFSLVVRQGDKVVNAIAFVNAMILVLAFTQNWKRSTKGLSIVCLVASCCYSLLSGARGGALGIIISTLFILSIINIRYGISRANNTKIVLKICVISFLILLPAFYVSLPLVGRETTGSFTDYISFYFGGGLASLEYKINHAVGGLGINNQFVGLNTFYGLYSFLHKIGIIQALPAFGNDWVNLGGYSSNIYTCFYRYYADFGILGVGALSFLAGFIYTAIYHAALSSKMIWMIPLWGNMARTLVDVGRDEILFGGNIFAANFYNTLIYIIIITIFLCGIRASGFQYKSLSRSC